MASNGEKKHRGRPSDHPPIQIWKEVDGHWCRFKDTYETYADAARAIGGNMSKVRDCALGKALTHKGCAFRFDDPNYRRDEIEHSRMDHGRDYSNTTSKHVGVYRDSRTGAWRSQIRINKQCMSLGSYKTEEEALDAQREYCVQRGIEWPPGPNKW